MRTTAYLKAIMEDYGKTFSGLGPIRDNGKRNLSGLNFNTSISFHKKFGLRKAYINDCYSDQAIFQAKRNVGLWQGRAEEDSADRQTDGRESMHAASHAHTYIHARIHVDRQTDSAKFH